MTDGGYTKEEVWAMQSAAREARFRKILVEECAKAGLDYPGNAIFDEAEVPTPVAVAAMIRVAEAACNSGVELGRFLAEIEAEG